MVLPRFVGRTFCGGNSALWPRCPAVGRVWGWGKEGRRHDASCRDAWCQAVQGLPWLLHSSPEAVGGSPGQPGPQQPGKTHLLPAAGPREGVAPLQGAPYPQPGGPSSAPALRLAPAPGFQNHSALDRQAIQPIRSRKASTQRSLSAVGQSASLDPYIPPSEDKLCLGPAAILSVAEVPLRLGVPFLTPAPLLSPRPHRGALTRGAASPAGPLRAAERFPGGGKTVWLPHAGLSAPS